MTAHEIVSVQNGTVVTANTFSGQQTELSEVSLIVYSTPRLVCNEFDWSDAAWTTRYIGDCVSPRDLMSAIHEGHAVANGI